MNLNQFDGQVIDIDEDWDITDAPADIKHTYDEILWELKEYEGDCADDFAVLHDKTIYRVLLIFRMLMNKAGAEGELLDDLGDLSKALKE